MSSRRLSFKRMCNVALLPRHADTNANESTSGRCYWEAEHGSRHWTWHTARRAIDGLFFFDRGPEGEGHCTLADRRDYLRAKEKVRRYEHRSGAPE